LKKVMGLSLRQTPNDDDDDDDDDDDGMLI